MNIAKAVEIARRVLEQHGGIDIAICGDMRPHATPVNPDNPEQVDNAIAYNTMLAFNAMVATTSMDGS
jgi:hypothetical protein